MAIDPFQFMAAFLAACLVLAVARAHEAGKVPRQFSLRTLLIVVTIIAAALGVVAMAIER